MAEEYQNGEFRPQELPVFSKSVRAGKRTYFFDVRTTKGNEFFLTITESKKKMSPDGKFFYEKHKLIIYKEDFEKFDDGLTEALGFINGNTTASASSETSSSESSTTDVEFEDLGK
jgi:Protein of unknown function (DUF3276)